MRRGSLEYRPHRMAQKPLPRMRHWAEIAEPSILSLVAFKAGMTHFGIMGAPESPAKGQEIIRAATVLAIPMTFVYGIRLYKKNYVYTQASAHVYDKTAAQRAGLKNAKGMSVGTAKKMLPECDDVTALAIADPAELKIGIKKKVRFEIHVGGKTAEEKFNFIEKLLGKDVSVGDVLKAGEFVDVLSITKGKGWQGVIKRFGVAKQPRKATGKVRHVGTLGAWNPPKVMYTVPQAGHMGFNYRTELNKRVLKIGDAQQGQISPSGGFLHFGPIRGQYVAVDGSVPGPAKRLVRLRKALRPSETVKEPKITYLSVTSKQGA